MSDPETRIVAYLGDALSASGAAVAVEPATPLLASGLLDSMGLVSLIVFIEEQFGIAIGDDALDPALFETPASIAAYVSGRLAGAGALTPH